MRVAAVVFLLCLAGCDEPPVPPAKTPAAPTPIGLADPVPSAPETPAKPGQDAEALPDAPKLDAANTHKPLTPDGALLVEVAPDPADAKKTKAVRLLVQCVVVSPRAPSLEVLLCKSNTKEHEAILHTAVDAKFLHSGLVALGMNPGSPVQFVDPKSGEAKYVAASGAKVAVAVHYRRAGKLHTHPAQEWITDVKTKKPMAHEWVFAGSRFFKDPDEPTKAPYYGANGGDVIAVSNFPDSMLDLPVSVGSDNADLAFEGAYDRVPPPGSKVWVILSRR